MGSSDNKRLVKNTGFLYIRMLFNLSVTLYTSRVVVDQLGASDYGIYTVVGGLVTLFMLLSNAMTSSISRFLTFDLAKNETDHLRKIFSTSVNIQFLLSFFVILVIETAGVWFLNYRMEIPPGRMVAANWVLQCAMLTFVLNMISIPYNSAIIAHEKMNAFAYISILETLLKLGVAFLLAFKIYDSLITYAILTALTAVIIRMIYGIYCTRHFNECKYEFVFEKKIFKEIFSFSGWNFIGAISGALRNQGVSILINLFFGTLINAAQGLATNVSGAVQSFSLNFMTALNPQIIKSFAIGNLDRTKTLVMGGARMAFFLLLTLSIPIIVSTDQLMRLWLVDVPELTVIFVRLVLILGLSDSLSNTLLTANQATGDIKIYQIVVGGIQLMNFPFVYFAYKFGMPAQSSYIIAIILSQIALFVRIFILRNKIQISISEFLNNVYWRVMVVSFLSFLPIYYLYNSFPFNFLNLLWCSFISAILTISLTLLIGCTSAEREMIGFYIKKIINKVRSKDA